MKKKQLYQKRTSVSKNEDKEPLPCSRFKTLPKKKPIPPKETSSPLFQSTVVPIGPKKHVKAFQNCTGCPLHALTTQKVFYRGSNSPKVLFVGEAPGESEDACGMPFMGVSGRLLNQAFADAKIPMEARAITNAIACTPFTDTSRSTIRTPTKEEIKACSPRLKDLINSTSPVKLVALGDKASQALKLLKVDFLHLMHPAFILRKGGTESVDYKRFVLQLRKLKQEMGL